MTRQEIFERTALIFKTIFGEAIHLTEDTASTDIEKWDSMNHVILISTIEKEFTVSFELMEIIGISKLGDFIDLVEKKQSQCS